MIVHPNINIWLASLSIGGIGRLVHHLGHPEMVKEEQIITAMAEIIADDIERFTKEHTNG